jgi:hypothetical protein
MAAYKGKKLVSSKFQQSLGAYLAKIFWHRIRSAATSSRSTDPASLYRQCSRILYVQQKGAIQPSPDSLSSSGTSNSSSNFAHLAHSIGPFTVSPFISICLTHMNKACSTSGLVTTCGCFDDKAFGLQLIRASNSGRRLRAQDKAD